MPFMGGCGREVAGRLPGAEGETSRSEGRGQEIHIATTWPLQERLRLESELKDWSSGQPSDDLEGAPRLVWEDFRWPTRTGSASIALPRVDVLLGGALGEYVRLARSGKFAEPADDANPRCLVLRSHSAVLSGGPPSMGGSLALDDPRIDLAALSWFDARLTHGLWQDGYAGLVRLAGHCALPMGWRRASAAARLARGEVRRAILQVPCRREGRPPEEGATEILEAVTILAGSRREQPARRFLRFLADRHGATPLSLGDAPDPDAQELLGELLGATLVDAQDELLAAWNALGGVESAPPSAALSWMTEPPPWPPASVQRLLVRDGDRGLAMAQDLAGQLTPDAQVRFWLTQSWLRPGRPVDGAFLAELSGAAEGKLVREPRFRNWLRCEWTAWARQRYRRVARLAKGAVPAQEGSTDGP